MDDKELDTIISDLEKISAESLAENTSENKAENTTEITAEESIMPPEDAVPDENKYIPAEKDIPQMNEEIVVYDAENDVDDDDDDEYDSEAEEAAKEKERLRLKEKRQKKKRKKKTHGRLIFALLMVTLVISVAVMSAVAVISISTEILGINRSDSEFSVEIPENSGTEAIANLLTEEGIIGNPTLFRIVSKINGADGTYVAGSHKLNPNMTYGDIIETLQQEAINPREFVTITFPEGITLTEAAAKLEEAGVCPAADFIQVFNSTSFGFDFEEHVIVSAKKFYKMEGFFFPDTYQFYLDEDPANIAKKVCKNFEYKVTPDMYGRMEDLDMTLEEVITLASIVQREAGDNYNMKMVASVFHNRLNNPDTFPLLQSDPTSNYVEDVIIPNMEIYSQSLCDSYDTYVGGGLPPGAICNPGIDAIEAVLYPRESPYFYFCSDLTTGEFFYAETLDEHEANLVKANLV